MKIGAQSAGGSKLSGLFKDKRVQLGAAAAAALGLVVLLKKGGGAAAVDGGGDASGQTITPAQFDSTGTDVYNAIQSVGQAWDQDLRDFTDQLGDIQDQIGKITPPKSGTTSPPISKPPAKPPVKKPPVKKPPVKKPPDRKAYETVSKWTSHNTPWDSTLSGIAKHYKVSISTLYKLNPQLHGKSTIHPNQKIRVK